MTISDLYQNAKAIDLADIFSDVIAKNEQHLINLNHNQLYKDSSDSEGNQLQQYNSLEYAREKESMNPGIGFRNTDLYYTGAFYRGWSLLITNTGFLFDSSDSKTSDLIEKYGQNIFGLRKDNLESFAVNIFAHDFFTELNTQLSK
jgi:hypothetical protein